MIFEVTCDTIRKHHGSDKYTYNEKWNIVAVDKGMVEGLLRIKANRANVIILKVHKIKKL